MGQGAHKGHNALARERIDRARQHYETRAERRPKQRYDADSKTWRKN